MDRAMFEGDSAVIKKVLSEPQPNQISYGYVIRETTVLAATMGQHHFSHFKCQGNVVAHALALDLIVWMKELPSQYYYVLMFGLITE